MIRILQFEGGNPRHVHYRTFLGYVLDGRGGKGPQDKVSNQEQRSESRLRAHLRSISVVDESMLDLVNSARAKEKNLPPLEAPDDPLMPDPRPQTLIPDGGTLAIQQEDFTLLLAYAKDTSWQSQYAEMGMAFLDWLTAAKEPAKADTEDEAKPELKAVGGSRRGRTTG